MSRGGITRSRYFVLRRGFNEKPRQYAFKYADMESLKKEIEEFFSYGDVPELQEGMRVFEEKHPTGMSRDMFSEGSVGVSASTGEVVVYSTSLGAVGGG
jgi:N1221-like protein